MPFLLGFRWLLGALALCRAKFRVCDPPARGTEGQQGSLVLLSVCDPGVSSTLQTTLAMLSEALQVILLAGVHWVGNKMEKSSFGAAAQGSIRREHSQLAGGSCLHSQGKMPSKDQAVKYWEGALSVPALRKPTHFCPVWDF